MQGNIDSTNDNLVSAYRTSAQGGEGCLENGGSKKALGTIHKPLTGIPSILTHNISVWHCCSY